MMKRTAEVLIKKEVTEQFTDTQEFLLQCKREFEKLPNVKREVKSGIVVWHKKCYDEATEEESVQIRLRLS